MEYCRILGVNVAVTDMNECVSYLKDNLNALRGGEYVCVANVHTTVTAYENEEYKKCRTARLSVFPTENRFPWCRKNADLKTRRGLRVRL